MTRVSHPGGATPHFTVECDAREVAAQTGAAPRFRTREDCRGQDAAPESTARLRETPP